MIIKGVGKRLEFYKLDNKITFPVLENKLGLSKRSIQNIIDTDDVVKTETFFKIFKLLKLDVEAFLNMEVMNQINNVIENNGAVQNVLTLENRRELQYPDYFVFSLVEYRGKVSGGLFGSVAVADNLFTKYFAVIRKRVGVSDDVKLYGLKRNGFKNAALAGVSIYTLRSQARHSSFDETETYLKNSGINLLTDAEINKMTGLF